MNCIFCGSATASEPPEHIIPEGLIGERPFHIALDEIKSVAPSLLILDHSEVCGKCNNALGQLDKHLQDQFGFLRTVWNTRGTKSGKAATSRRPGMFARREKDGSHLILNLGPKPITAPDGSTITPYNERKAGVKVKSVRFKDGRGSVAISHPITINKRFIRGLHKIAFEMVCFQQGHQFALAPEFDSVRRYVRFGEGSRSIIVSESAKPGVWEIPSLKLLRKSFWPGWVAEISLGTIFSVELSPSNASYSNANPASLAARGLFRVRDTDIK